MQTKPKTFIPISGLHDKYVNSSIRNWVVSYFKLSHCHPNVFTFPALKTMWTQEIGKLYPTQKGIVLIMQCWLWRVKAMFLVLKYIQSVTEPHISLKLWLRNNTQFLALRNITHSIQVLWNLYIFGTARAVTCNLIIVTPEIWILHKNNTSYTAKTKQKNMLCWIIFSISIIWIIILKNIMTKNFI